ncbi:hypothetical protein EDC04DRAFT_3088697 [Pisolithus marmoratus]|nr:hypothetical protein EDC04DRAFT_3088697 [Pisolithus marmoratus]
MKFVWTLTGYSQHRRVKSPHLVLHIVVSMPNNLKVDRTGCYLFDSRWKSLRRHSPDLTCYHTGQLDRKGVWCPASNGVPTYLVQFIAQRVEGNVYTLTINGYRTVELEGRLFGAVEFPPQEWVITYRKNHDAYTITRRLDAPEEVGWIAPFEDEDEGRQIRIGPLVVGRSYPPFYPPQELFKFEFPEE